MSTNSINSLASSYIQSVLGATAAPSTKATTASVSAAPVQQPDNGQLSSFAQMMNTLQQLQKSNPAEYQQVTAQIATNFQAAAKTATSEGNTTAATQLTHLASTFASASTSAQPLNMQNVAKAMAKKHHHHGGGGHTSASSAASSSSSSSSTTASSTATPVSQFLASLQSSSGQSDTLNPTSIIASTLASAGITGSSKA